MEQYLMLTQGNQAPGMVRPEIGGNVNFEIKSQFMRELREDKFVSNKKDDAHEHVESILDIVSLFNIPRVTHDAVMLRAFPITLTGAAKRWVDRLTPEIPPTSAEGDGNDRTRSLGMVRILQRSQENGKNRTNTDTRTDRVQKSQKAPFGGVTTAVKIILKYLRNTKDMFLVYDGNTEAELRVDCYCDAGFVTDRDDTKSQTRYVFVLNGDADGHGFRASWEALGKTDERIDKLADQLSTLVEIVSKKVVTPAPVKAVEETCVTCGGAHSWYNCPTTDNNQASVCAATGSYNQVNPLNRVSNQMAPPGFAPVQNNGQNRFNQNQGQGNNFNRGNNFHASTSGILSSNTIPNPKGEIKAITTRSGVAYEGPSIPTNPSPKKVVEQETEETKDKEQSNFQGSTAQIPPPVTPISIQEFDVPKTLPKTTSIPEPDVPKSLPKPNIPFPSCRDDQKFAPTIKSLLMNKEKLLELAKIPLNENCLAMLLKKLPEKLGDPGKFLIPFCEEYTLKLLGFSNSSGGNPTSTSEPFTSEFILEEIEAYLKDDSISPEIDCSDCNPKEDICLIEKFLNNDPF
ncbi:hypothetical protein Tco_1404468 [Tanacetum coccineum]